MRFDYSLEDMTQEELSEVADSVTFQNCYLDEAIIDFGVAYISVYSAEGFTPYIAKFEGNEKFAPFEVKVFCTE